MVKVVVTFVLFSERKEMELDLAGGYGGGW